MSRTRLLLEGLGFPESTRWHDGRMWVCNWGAGEVLAVTPDGEPEVMARLAPRTLPFSIDWLPDGRLLVVDGPRRLLLRQEVDGSLQTVAALTRFGPAPFNELVADGEGNAYVNGGPGIVVRVAPNGDLQEVADGLQWPNGMAIVDDGRTLVVADSRARQLVGFDVAADGTLSGRRTWADLEQAPDGICADADGAVALRAGRRAAGPAAAGHGAHRLRLHHVGAPRREGRRAATMPPGRRCRRTGWRSRRPVGCARPQATWDASPRR